MYTRPFRNFCSSHGIGWSLFASQQSHFSAIQLAWVNFLMESLASLALASDPHVDGLLQKPPVNRSSDKAEQTNAQQ